MAKIIQFPRNALIGLVKTYQLLFSPWVGHGCRFTPSCSRYAIHSLEKHGAIKGSFYTVKRILKCHPFHAGGPDPVP